MRQVSHEFKVEPREDGKRLDALLAARYPSFSRVQWQSRIRLGSVEISGKRTRPAHRVQTGERICFNYQTRAEPDVRRDYEIVYEDADLLLINKPTNLPVHPSGVYHENTLVHLLRSSRGQDFVVRLVHRIDRETSGLLLVAKSREAARHLQRQFLRSRVEKEYTVIVEGEFPQYIDASGWLYRDPDSAVRRKMRYSRTKPEAARDLRDARTELMLMERVGPLSVVSARIHTGRLHQIRATCLGLGYPVVGDRLYGLDERFFIRLTEHPDHSADDEIFSDDLKTLRLPRTALHSRSLAFEHPSSGKRVCFEAPLPDDLVALVDRHR